MHATPTLQEEIFPRAPLTWQMDANFCFEAYMRVIFLARNIYSIHSMKKYWVKYLLRIDFPIIHLAPVLMGRKGWCKISAPQNTVLHTCCTAINILRLFSMSSDGTNVVDCPTQLTLMTWICQLSVVPWQIPVRNMKEHSAGQSARTNVDHISNGCNLKKYGPFREMLQEEKCLIKTKHTGCPKKMYF